MPLDLAQVHSYVPALHTTAVAGAVAVAAIRVHPCSSVVRHDGHAGPPYLNAFP